MWISRATCVIRFGLGFGLSLKGFKAFRAGFLCTLPFRVAGCGGEVGCGRT